VNDFVSVRAEPFSSAGQLDVLARAIKQLDAELALQLRNRCRQSRLDHVDPLSGTRETELVRHGDEVLNLS
jgi:hypothetical protein